MNLQDEDLVYVNSEPVCVIEFLDIMDAQFASFPDTYVSHGDTMSLEIVDAYPADVWDDTAITEVILFGAH